MKIRILTAEAAAEMKKDQQSEQLHDEWQTFLSQVCDSIEERRKRLNPKSFRPKEHKQGS